jgi:SAM-dependent methyltransferase
VKRSVRFHHKHLKSLPRPFIRGMRKLYLKTLDLSDRFRNRNTGLTPPRALHFVGGGDFHHIGESFLGHFIKVCGLQPNERVLDIGCGTGRMAIPLLNFLDASGSYVGFDISEKAIRWCREHISARNERFSFYFSDIHNSEYNPKGRLRSTDYRFPCDTASKDFIFATSVFTHMTLPEVRHYLSEIRRVLSPSGRAFLSFFIMDKTNLALLREGKTSIPFSATGDNYYTIDPRTPERAIAFAEGVLLPEFSKADLKIQPPILYGSWSGRTSMLDAQDVIIAKP